MSIHPVNTSKNASQSSGDKNHLPHQNPVTEAAREVINPNKPCKYGKDCYRSKKCRFRHDERTGPVATTQTVAKRSLRSYTAVTPVPAHAAPVAAQSAALPPQAPPAGPMNWKMYGLESPALAPAPAVAAAASSSVSGPVMPRGTSTEAIMIAAGISAPEAQAAFRLFDAVAKQVLGQ